MNRLEVRLANYIEWDLICYGDCCITMKNKIDLINQIKGIINVKD